MGIDATRLIGRLRVLALGSYLSWVTVITVVVTDSLNQLFTALTALTMVGCLVAWLAWNKAPALLSVCASAAALVCALLAMEASPAAERLIAVSLANRVDASPRLLRSLEHRSTLRRDFFEPFGTDATFYRRKPGSLHWSIADGESTPFLAKVDGNGFLNDPKNDTDIGGIVVAGDSVFQGVGMPGVVDRLLTDFPIRSVSTSGYGPRQKVEALQQFGIRKHAQVLVLDFYSGNDASDEIENDLCKRSGEDFHCRFSYPYLRRQLWQNEEFRGMLSRTDSASVFLSAIRSPVFSLALARQVAVTTAKMLKGTARPNRNWSEAITMPGFTHIAVETSAHKEWIKSGLELTKNSMTELALKARESGTEVLVIYNPTSYEIYREILPPDQISTDSDEISQLQRERLAAIAKSFRADYCDMTPLFRQRVSDGKRGLFGQVDGTHWSSGGTEVAAQILSSCLRRWYSPARQARSIQR